MADQENNRVRPDQSLVPASPNTINWMEIAAGAAVVAATFAAEQLKHRKEDVLHHIISEVQQEDNPLHSLLEAAGPEERQILLDLAGVAFLKQPQQALLTGESHPTAGQRIISIARRLDPRALLDQSAAFSLMNEAKGLAKRQGRELSDFFPAAEALGQLAYINRDQHAPQS